MKQVVWMSAGCLGGGIIATTLVGRPAEVWLGLAGPLLAAAVTWLLVVRAHRQDPARVGSLLVAAFGVKMVFFGAYVVAVSRVPGLDLLMFGGAFFVSFVVLYVVQALLLRGLTAPQAS